MTEESKDAGCQGALERATDYLAQDAKKSLRTKLIALVYKKLNPSDTLKVSLEFSKKPNTVYLLHSWKLEPETLTSQARTQPLSKFTCFAYYFF